MLPAVVATHHMVTSASKERSFPCVGLVPSFMTATNNAVACTEKFLKTFI